MSTAESDRGGFYNKYEVKNMIEAIGGVIDELNIALIFIIGLYIMTSLMILSFIEYINGSILYVPYRVIIVVVLTTEKLLLTIHIRASKFLKQGYYLN